MDELELLKKDWQKDNIEYPKLSKQDIFPMLLKKSSSIVKWILIIGIIEFIIVIIPIFLFGDDNIDSLGLSGLFRALEIINGIVLIYFLYRFFNNYRAVSVTDSAKKLMENILQIRKTVKYYVASSLTLCVIGSLVAITSTLKNDPEMSEKLNNMSADGEIFKYYAAIIIGTILILAVVIGIVLLIYWLIYGLLLNRLNRNYRELKKLEL